MSNKRALLMLSGGIDSVYVMYKALSEGRHLHVHHIHLRNREGRVDAEARAVRRVLAWMRRKGLTNFRYTESTVDYGSLRFLVKDFYTYALFIGMIMSDPKNRDMDSFLHPRHSDAFNLRNGKVSFEQAAERANAALTGIPSLMARREIKMELPIGSMTKADVIEACPPDLLRLAWFCRRPVKVGASFHQCNSCFTCAQVNESVYRRKVARV
ncbi:hypothetical protein ABT332_06620 [Saccharomonospora azurea]|uniref:hypothetical protein n=1 Tax=Saccharomonospora azurea TaxID=40988 RepID=UPI00332E4220